MKLQDNLSSCTVLVLSIVGIYGASVVSDQESGSPPKLLVLAFDGLRPESVKQDLTPNIYKMATEGVWARNGMIPQFPTITMPNFYSISTGLCTESHGIIGNAIYQTDPKYEKFDYFDNETGSPAIEISRQPKWYKGMPIYLINEMAGGGRRTGCMGWPSCDVKFHRGNVSYVRRWVDYGTLKQWKVEFDELQTWFESKDMPINFGLYYICEPDETQHYNDIYGSVVQDKLRELDEMLGYILDKVRNSPDLKSKLNIILLSDHGHTNVKAPDGLIDLTEAVPRAEQKKMVWQGRWSLIPAKKGISIDWDNVYKRLKKLKETKGLHFQLYRKSNFPNKDYHWSNNKLVGNVILFPDPGYVLLWDETAEDVIGYKKNATKWGDHGYTSKDRTMRATFIGYGPAFKTSCEVSTPFQNIDVYPLMASILNVKPGPNNGSLDAVKDMLRSGSSSYYSNRSYFLFFAVMFIASLPLDVAN